MDRINMGIYYKKFIALTTFLANLPLFLDSLLVVSIGIALFMIKNSIKL